MLFQLPKNLLVDDDVLLEDRENGVTFIRAHNSLHVDAWHFLAVCDR